MNSPILEKMALEKRLAPIDLALANLLLNRAPDVRKEVFLFLCHLSMATRKGHLCVIVGNSTLLPPPEELWQQAFDEDVDLTFNQLKKEEIEAIRSYISLGALYLPEFLVSDAEQDNNHKTPICRFKDHYYFQRFWIKETALLRHIHFLLNTPTSLKVDEKKVSVEIEALLKAKKILFEQSQAILRACQESVTILCGGPGTGKTYTSAQLIKVLWKALSDDQKKDFEIVLAAPTGKAAANLQKSLSQVIPELEGLKPIKAQTLHRLLGIRHSKNNKEAPRRLKADLLLIDESSMIDVDLMVSLLEAIKPGARLILLGDPNQLPSVEAGGVFADLVNSGISHPVVLKQCMRAELKVIVDFAAIIQANRYEEALSFFSQGIEHHEINANFKNEIMQEALPFFEGEWQDPLEMIAFFNRFRILSPLRKGPYGIEAINALFRKKRMPFIPIILTKNDSEMGLFNGETGVLVKKDPNQEAFQAGDFAIFPGDNPKETKKIPAILLPPFEEAYCLSVHKSQGSEFNQVLLVLPEGSEIFGKQVLYTAVTRAKQKLAIWGSLSTFKQTLAHPCFRLSGITIR